MCPSFVLLIFAKQQGHLSFLFLLLFFIYRTGYCNYADCFSILLGPFQYNLHYSIFVSLSTPMCKSYTVLIYLRVFCFSLLCFIYFWFGTTWQSCSNIWRFPSWFDLAGKFTPSSFSTPWPLQCLYYIPYYTFQLCDLFYSYFFHFPLYSYFIVLLCVFPHLACLAVAFVHYSF